MIRTATMEIVNRTGCGRLVIDDHVVTSARRVLTEHRDSTTFERRNRTVRMEFATTDHDHGINDSSPSLAVAARNSLRNAERFRRSGSFAFAATGLREAIPCGRASTCEYDNVIHSRIRRARAHQFRWPHSQQPRMSFPGSERRRPANRALGIQVEEISSLNFISFGFLLSCDQWSASTRPALRGKAGQ
jgi:hypothetical protein